MSFIYVISTNLFDIDFRKRHHASFLNPAMKLTKALQLFGNLDDNTCIFLLLIITLCFNCGGRKKMK